MRNNNPGSWEEAATIKLLQVYIEKLRTSVKGNVQKGSWEEMAEAVSKVQPKTVKQCRDKVDALKKRLKRPVKEGVPSSVVDGLLREAAAVADDIKAGVVFANNRGPPAAAQNHNRRNHNNNRAASPADDSGHDMNEDDDHSDGPQPLARLPSSPDDGDDYNAANDDDDDNSNDDDDDNSNDDSNNDDSNDDGDGDGDDDGDGDGDDDDDEPPSRPDHRHSPDHDDRHPTRITPFHTTFDPKGKTVIHPSFSKNPGDPKGEEYYQIRLSNSKGAHRLEAGPSSPKGTSYYFEARSSSPQGSRQLEAIPSDPRGPSQFNFQYRYPHSTPDTTNVQQQSYKFASPRASKQPYEGAESTYQFKSTPLASNKKRTSGAFNAKVQQEIEKICEDVTTSIRGPKRLQVLSTTDSTQALANAISHLSEVYADIQLAKLHIFRITHQNDQNEP